MSTQQSSRSGIASLSALDPLSLPAGANPRRDRRVGTSELGGSVYESPSGVRYTIREEVRSPRYESAPGTLDRVREVGGDVYEAVSGAVSDPVGALRSIAEGVYGPVARMVRGEGTYEDLLGTAGMVAAPTIGARPDPNVARMFGGRSAQDPIAQRSMDLAEQLRDEGLDPEEIWRRTAAEFPEAPSTVLPDGSPVFEFSDAETLTLRTASDRATELFSQANREGVPLEDKLLLQQEAERLIRLPLQAGVIPTPISKLVSGPELFSRYPTLGDARGQLMASLPSWARAEYYPDKDFLRVSNLLKDEEVRSSVLHELQHGIARRDPSVPQGTSPITLQRLAEEASDPLKTQARYINYSLGDLNQMFENDPIGGVLVDGLVGRLAAGMEEINAPIKKAYSGRDPNMPFFPENQADPGETLARITQASRDLSMAERGEFSPMARLRQTEGKEWSQTRKISSPAEMSEYLGFNKVEVEGLPPASYTEAADLFIRNQLPVLVEEIKDRYARSGNDPEVLKRGRTQISIAFSTALSKYR